MYMACCGRYLDADAGPLTAEQLMRSRYCAYIQRNSQYLLHSWSAATRPSALDLRQDDGVKWLGLKIVATEAGAAEDTDGIVEFVARYKVNGKAVRLHERSRFERVDGQWFYVDGIIK
jgi:SEC-C motif-containing protein